MRMRWLILAASLGVIGLLATPLAYAAAAVQKTFGTAESAAQALHDAVRANDPRELAALLGPAGRDIIESGDPAEDMVGRVRFVAAYERFHQVEVTSPHRAVLVIGDERWRFPFPLVGGPSRWHFNTAEGRKEVIARRIGRNELAAIQAVLAYVDAQREYAAVEHDGVGPGVYAERIASSAGRHDGLYWTPTRESPLSPLGPLFALAAADETGGSASAPYHGYLFRVLRSQGPHARNGIADYVVRARMMAGFALVAWPARHRVSGVRTFIVSQDGEVYSRDFGKDTDRVARTMLAYDPGQGWQRESDAVPASQESASTRRLAGERGCTVCHQVAPSAKGADAATPLAPSFREIGERYRADPSAEERLTHVIQQGADPADVHWRGRAEFTSMRAASNVSPDEARAIVRWILLLQ